MNADRKLIDRLQELANRLEPRDKVLLDAAALRLRQLGRGEPKPKLRVLPPSTATPERASLQPKGGSNAGR